jgi:cyclomaltodextrinase / maltogenic alpha-amylase / neopullulanase
VPEWSRGIIWYQILIDRFQNGDAGNDPIGKEVLGDSLYQWDVSTWTSNWYKLTIKESLFNTDFYPNAYLRQYGGDYKGIEERIPYLKKLGVDALLLSPVFAATSAHKYDVQSYHHTCRHFGHKNGIDTTYLNRENPADPKTWYLTSSDRDFVDLTKSLHDSGLKVVVDVQFAHVSPRFWAFNDVLKKQELSVFGSWFDVSEWDKAETPFKSEFTYKSMWGVNSFPLFRTDSLGLVTGPKEYVFAATKRWLDPDGDGNPSDGIDGWRVTLTSWLPEAFWVEWTAMVKSVNPQAIVIAEWNEISKSPPDCFDIVYSKKTAEGLSGALLSHKLYPTQLDVLVSENVMQAKDPDAAITIVGDLETDRVASQCVNAALDFESENTPQRNASYVVAKPNAAQRRLQKQLLLLQFTLVGSPMIYYGDEAGMWGADDPDNRKPMLWPDMKFDDETSFSINGDAAKHEVMFDSAVYNFYRSLIELREQHLALKYGSVQTLVIDDEKRLYAFKRESGSDRVWVVMNASDKPGKCSIPIRELPSGSTLTDPFANVDFQVSNGGITIVLPPRTVSLILPGT